jgi:hypothetical protein
MPVTMQARAATARRRCGPWRAARGLLAALSCVALLGAVAEAGEARVTAATRRTIYIDAGAADGLRAGTAWRATVAGAPVSLRVAAVAQHGASIEVDGGAAPSVGAAVPLPDDLRPPPPAPPPRAAPPVLPPWRSAVAAPALQVVRRQAARSQPLSRAALAEARTAVRGELSVSLLAGADLESSSTSWQDLSLASQLAVEHGAWRYDHAVDAHVPSAPELFFAPLQHGSATLDVYLLRLGWAPRGGRLGAALGRQPAAPLGELGMVDGVRARVGLVPGLDTTIFAGLRPASDLGLSAQPRAGVDVGWQRAGPVRARADVGLAAELWHGDLDRALAAAALTLGSRTLFVAGDVLVDGARDAAGVGGLQLSHAAVHGRLRRARLSATASGGYDRPFLSHQLLDELPGLSLGNRGYGQLGLGWASGGLDLDALARGAHGDGVSSLYLELSAAISDPARGRRYFATPHLLVATLGGLEGLRAGLSRRWGRWELATSGVFDRASSGGAVAWSGGGRITASGPLTARWRVATAVELAGGDGPLRGLAFALIGVRLGE